MSRRTQWLCYRTGAILSEAAFGADLGGSSKYSNANFED